MHLFVVFVLDFAFVRVSLKICYYYYYYYYKLLGLLLPVHMLRRFLSRLSYALYLIIQYCVDPNSSVYLYA